MIKLLDKTTIDKIAAGEVIERPSSVVKELLENSIDAGASVITVEIKEGGLSFIRVTDNGCGIPKEEVKTAYLRHATSKIETAEDLSCIESLGFRGEALSTIAAVSQTEMITKIPEDLIGIKYVIHGGMEIEYSEVGVPDGTTIVVRNLFFNTPARKKFLKSAMTEGSYINDLVLKLALSHPNIAFKLISNGQVKIDTSGNGKIKDTIYQLFGRDITTNLIELNFANENIKISGYIGKPFLQRGNRGLENYFINNRYIKSNVINRAIEEGYKTFVMQHKFPFTVLYFELMPEKCDINVHPTKMEFKYENEKELFEVVTKAVRNSLEGREIIPKDETRNEQNNTVKEKNSERPPEPFENQRNVSAMMPTANSRVQKYTPSYSALEDLIEKETKEVGLIKEDGVLYTPTNNNTEIKEEAFSTSKQEQITPSESGQQVSPIIRPAINAYQKTEENARIIKDGQMSLFEDDFLTEKARKKHRIIGQLFGTYWLIEYERNLYIMDQHAAHEKVNFERLMKDFENKEILQQQLLPPIIVSVSYIERQAILDNYDLFMRFGFDISEFGGNEFKISAVPSNLYGIGEKDLFMDFVSSLINNNGYMSHDVFIKKLATMACKASVKGNMHISVEEADALIDELLTLDNPYTCPHGRPTIISISEAELEKKFKRVI